MRERVAVVAATAAALAGHAESPEPIAGSGVES